MSATCRENKNGKANASMPKYQHLGNLSERSREFFFFLTTFKFKLDENKKLLEKK